MSPFHQYLTEEVALDHVDGLISRREALRRLGMLGLTAGAAVTLIAACSEDVPRPRPARPPRRVRRQGRRPSPPHRCRPNPSRFPGLPAARCRVPGPPPPGSRAARSW